MAIPPPVPTRAASDDPNAGIVVEAADVNAGPSIPRTAVDSMPSTLSPAKNFTIAFINGINFIPTVNVAIAWIKVPADVVPSPSQIPPNTSLRTVVICDKCFGQSISLRKTPILCPKASQSTPFAISTREVKRLSINFSSFWPFSFHLNCCMNVVMPPVMLSTRSSHLKFTVNDLRESNAPFKPVANTCAMFVKLIFSKTPFNKSANAFPISA